MLSTILTSLQSWVGTPTGLMTLAIIFTLGIIIAFFMVVVVNNSRSELKEFHERYNRDIDALKLSLETQKVNFEGESKKFAESTTALEKSRQNLSADLGDLRGQLYSKTSELEHMSDEVGAYRLELGKLRTNDQLLSRGLFGLGRMLSNLIGQKVCEVRTYLVSGGMDDAGQVKVFFTNVTEAVNEIAHDKDLSSLNLDHIMQLNRDTVQEDSWLLPIHKIANSHYHTDLSSLETIAPLHYISILYIRSLDMKFVLTDYNIYADIQVNEPELIEAHRILREGIETHIRQSIRTNTNYMIVTPEVAASLGAPFEDASLFNKSWLDKVKPTAAVGQAA